MRNNIFKDNMRQNDKTEPFVSIIIVNYNGAKYLHECLNSIKKIEYRSYEVIIIDNASSDDSIPIIKNEFPWVRMVKLSNNFGFANGSNIGSKYANGEFLVFLNNDTKVDTEWLSELVKVIISDNSIATCGSKMFFYGGDIINHAGASITLLGNSFDIGFGQKDSDEYNKQT